jgi:hypothetical protein
MQLIPWVALVIYVILLLIFSGRRIRLLISFGFFLFFMICGFFCKKIFDNDSLWFQFCIAFVVSDFIFVIMKNE